MGGSRENFLAGICHAGILFAWLGVALSLFVAWSEVGRDEWLARQARQAAGYQVSVLVGLWLLRNLLIPAGILIGLAWAVLLVVGLLAAGKAWRGEDFLYPLVGVFIERYWPGTW